MADEDRNQDGPSLELPSFGFGRKRGKQKAEPSASPADAAADEAPDEAADETRPMSPTPAEEPPAPEPVREAPAPAAEPTPEPAAARPPEPEPTPVPEAPAAPPLFVDEAAPQTHGQVQPEPLPSPAAASSPPEAQPPAPAPARATKRRLPQLPALDGRVAAGVTGLLVGILTVGLTWASLGLCNAVKGTSSCGNPGYLLLVAILIGMGLLGSALLRAWDIADATSTSFLAVGLLAVFVLVFLVGALESWTMILVIPLVAAAAYALSHWVTTSITEDAAH